MRELLMAPGSGADLKDEEEEQVPKGPHLSPNTPELAEWVSRMTSSLQDSSKVREPGGS